MPLRLHDVVRNTYPFIPLRAHHEPNAATLALRDRAIIKLLYSVEMAL